MNDRVVWVQGYSGQGITPCRFGARGGLALLGLGETELARLAFVQRRPAHWPPHAGQRKGSTSYTLRIISAQPLDGT